MTNKSLVATADGSLSLFDHASRELFHNRAGAFSEAKSNFVAPTNLLERSLNQKRLSVLDAPFGLGYNSFCLIELLLEQMQQLKQKTTLEQLDVVLIEFDRDLFPLLTDVLASPCFIHLGSFKSELQQTIAQLGNGDNSQLQAGNLTINFRPFIADMRASIKELSKENWSFDAIFHDPFSPKSMPEFWTLELFEHYKKMMAPESCIVTYCAATAVRSAFRIIGLDVYRTPALGAKASGTAAITKGHSQVWSDLMPILDEELARMDSRSGTPYRDADLNKSRLEILNTRRKEIAEIIRQEKSKPPVS